MSTRAQIQVIGGNEKLTMYKHTDGYPGGVLPLFKQAYDMPFNREVKGIDGKLHKADIWRAGRTFKVASYICSTEPGTIEPLDYHDLHGDIEYFYKVTIKTDLNEDNPQWYLEVFTSHGSDWYKEDKDGNIDFDAPRTLENMRQILDMTNVKELPESINE